MGTSSPGCAHVSTCTEIRLPQGARDLQDGRLLVLRYILDRYCVDDTLQFRWTSYGLDDLRFLSPKWIRSGPEIRAWRSVVPIVYFDLVHMHHVDRIVRQFGADQPILVDPVNVDRFLRTKGRGEDVWCHRTTRSLYESWMRQVTDLVVVEIVLKPDFRGNWKYLDWWSRVCRSRFLLDDRLLQDPRVQVPPADIRSTPSQPWQEIQLTLDAPTHRRCPGGRVGDTGGLTRRS
ncbi:hypothetical protein PIB30_023557 [Stylosanthes scabra]|uniref:Aminotransferase-like plant mobile domain-containing protein n=1 Tax=Stylosanthes scabra TaxID=79078 RepID=A0ABU6WAG9_9FABA|nr:hypothetical protein [Stylosanthes scabra]